MNEKRVCLIITLVGIFVIILVQVLINIDDENIEKNENYIKENLITLTKECIRDNKCNLESITIDKLNNEKYLSENLLKKLESYSFESYIEYPSYNVILIKKEDN